MLWKNAQTSLRLAVRTHVTAQKVKFFIKDFFSKCDQILRKLRNWSHLRKKSSMENLFFVQCELCQSKKQHVKGSSRAVVITISLFFCVTTSSQFKPSCGTVLKCTAREKGQDKGIDGKSYKK